MLKPEPRDTPLLIALLAVAFALLLTLSVGKINEGPPAQGAPPAKQDQSDGNSCSGASIIVWPICMTGNAIYVHREVINAFSTLIIGFFTFALFIATYGQLRYLSREFVSTHRPKLVVRRLKIDTPIIGQSVVIKCDLVNIGDTKATITRIELFMSRASINLDQVPEIDWAEAVPSGEAVAGGEAYDLVCDTHHILSDDAAVAFVPNYLRIGGEIRYADDNGVIRRTAFLRIALPPNGGRFRLLDPPDPDFEYVD